MLNGRQAGKKVVIIKQVDDGTKDRPYPHAIVAGIERYPRKVTKRMGKKLVARRSKVKPFIKVRSPSSCATVPGSDLLGARIGCQLLASVPNALRTRAGRAEGERHVRDVQGAVAARGREEDDKEAVRGAVHVGQEQVVLRTTEGEFTSLAFGMGTR